MPAAIAGEEKYPYPASGLEKAIGYTFRNQELLLNALRHSSYSNETKKMQNASNERLEFLGDSVLSVIVSDYIYRNYANLDEGDLTKIRASVVCENSLAALAARLELGSYMYLGHGEIVTHGRNRKSIVADAFEALLAAIYLDGGIERARAFLLPMLEGAIAESASRGSEDYKSKLQKIVQQTPEELPRIRANRRGGAAARPHIHLYRQAQFQRARHRQRPFQARGRAGRRARGAQIFHG